MFHRAVLALVAAPATLAWAQPAPNAAPPPPPIALAATRLTLDEAIARALQNNRSIKVSELGRGIARANVLAEYGRFDPALTFRRSYSESENVVGPTAITASSIQHDQYAAGLEGILPLGTLYNIGGRSSNYRGLFNNYRDTFESFGGISVTQPLLRGFGLGANLASLRIAKADRAISDWEYRQTVIDTVTNVILVYSSLAEARDGLRIAVRFRDLAARLVTENEARNRVGSLSDADVTQARARAAYREEQILLAQRQIKVLANQLRALIGEGGIAADAPDFVVDPLTPLTTPPMDGAAELNRALQLRPDYQAARQVISRRRATRSLAVNQLLPQVDFVGSYGHNGLAPDFATSRAQVRARDSRAYSAGVVVSVPLTFAEGRGRARAAKLSVQQAQTNLEAIEQEIAVGVANAIGQLQTAQERVRATYRAYELAQQALDAEEKRFRAGASSTFFVLQLQEQLAVAENSHVRAIADQRRAFASYERAVGATLINHNLQVQ